MNAVALYAPRLSARLSNTFLLENAVRFVLVTQVLEFNYLHYLGFQLLISVFI